MHSHHLLEKACAGLEGRLAYRFKNPELAKIACAHASLLNEVRNIVASNNERLEFLGDAVLSLLVSQHLYLLFPNKPEGELSPIRAHIVSATSCAQFIDYLHLESCLVLGRGERLGGGRETRLANFFEAILGALYLDGGLDAARQLLYADNGTMLEEALQRMQRNWKAILQEELQRRKMSLPSYRILEEHGPDHSRVFDVGAFVDDVLVGKGSGSNKRTAEQEAAHAALVAIAPQLLSKGLQ